MTSSSLTRSVGSTIAIGLAAAWLGASTPALAHTPYFDDGTHTTAAQAFPFADDMVSRVLYAELPCPNEPLFISMPTTVGDSLFVQLGIPVADVLKDYRPSLAIVGPGLPAAAGLPFALPDGDGALVYDTRGVTNPTIFHEPFTNTDSWILVEQTVKLTASGTYYVVAFAPEARRGRLWIATGTVERPEKSNVPNPITRVKYFADPKNVPTLGESCPAAGPPDKPVPTTGCNLSAGAGAPEGHGAALLLALFGAALWLCRRGAALDRANADR